VEPYFFREASTVESPAKPVDFEWKRPRKGEPVGKVRTSQIMKFIDEATIHIKAGDRRRFT
jgi:hypothetical protein